MIDLALGGIGIDSARELYETGHRATVEEEASPLLTLFF